MRKQLSANFARLWKSRVFWLGMATMCGLGIFAVIMRYRDILEDPRYAYTTADGIWFLGGLYVSIALSVFISLWLGTEYHDGTMRNKLTVGHTRGGIYAANWLTCALVALAMHLMYILTLVVFAALLLEPFKTPTHVLAISTLVSLLTVVAMASIFVMIAMLVSSKSTSAVASMIVALALLIGAFTVDSMLKAPEYHENAFAMSVDGEIIPSEPIPNPNYLRGAERAMYQFIQDFQPAGQMMQLNEGEHFPEHIARFPAYSLVLIVMTAGVGYALFRRKDIR